MAISQPKTPTWPADRKRRTKESLVWFERISGLEPGVTRDQIARRFGVTYDVAFKWTTFFGYQVGKDGVRKRVSAADWAAVDWSRPDLEIAAGLGIGVPKVKARRKSNESAHGRTRDEYDRFRDFISSHGHRLHCLRTSEIIRLSGCKVHPLCVTRHLRAAGVRPFDRSIPWRHIDWRLPNTDITRVWGRQPGDYANLRLRLKLPSPL